MAKENLSWQEALERLQSGNKNFQNDMLDGLIHNAKTGMKFVAGQEPFAIILSCADSRVVPELAFDVGIGEIFVIRVAGNIPNPSTLASIEYAVANLGVNLIIVLGHENCGAVGAALQGGDFGENLNHLLAYIQPALALAPNKEVNTVVRENAKVTAKALVNNSDIIRNLSAEREIKILPAFYNLASGKVDILSES